MFYLSRMVHLSFQIKMMLGALKLVFPEEETHMRESTTFWREMPLKFKLQQVMQSSSTLVYPLRSEPP